jgi:hypothetical protein
MRNETNGLFEIFKSMARCEAPRCSNLASKLAASETSCHFGSRLLRSIDAPGLRKAQCFFRKGIVAPFGRVILGRPFVAPRGGAYQLCAA